jgi:4-amino-4-deoxy-L-arabinose transferase-like glycosyltransferase
MFSRYGQLPAAPSVLDEVIVNDAAFSLGQGGPYAATSFRESALGLDHLFAHFPPLYPLTESFSVRLLGPSAYSLRLTTTLMSIAASFILLFLSYKLFRKGVLSLQAALFLSALYCTCGPLMMLERMARMESMISVFVLLALSFLLKAYFVQAPGSNALWIMLAGLATGLAMATHPEAITAVIFLTILTLFCPGRIVPKLAAGVLVGLIPLLVCLLTFRSQSLAAYRQFHAILTLYTPKDETLFQVLAKLIHAHSLFLVVWHYVVESIAILSLVIVFAYIFHRHELAAGSILRRLATAFAVAGAVEFLLMAVLLGANRTRHQFLFGPLLVAAIFLLFGARPVKTFWTVGLCAVIAVQLAVVTLYLYRGGERPSRMPPDRFAPVVQMVPPSASVLAMDELWLAFQQAHRPFTLRSAAFDGRLDWNKLPDPLSHFNVVITSEERLATDPWTRKNIAKGWLQTAYVAGDEKVLIFTRPGVILEPAAH